MKYILDASVAVRWVIPGPLTPRALQLRDEYLRKVHDPLAPDIFPGETASALTKAERQKSIRVGQAAQLYASIATAWPSFQSYLPLAARAIEVSSQTRSAFYDCLYVALAEREGCAMVTADDRLLKNLKGRFPLTCYDPGSGCLPAFRMTVPDMPGSRRWSFSKSISTRKQPVRRSIAGAIRATLPSNCLFGKAWT